MEGRLGEKQNRGKVKWEGDGEGGVVRDWEGGGFISSSAYQIQTPPAQINPRLVPAINQNSSIVAAEAYLGAREQIVPLF